MYVAKSIKADHEDLIHDVAYDFYGKRMATCSSDQKVKVGVGWSSWPLQSELVSLGVYFRAFVWLKFKLNLVGNQNQYTTTSRWDNFHLWSAIHTFYEQTTHTLCYNNKSLAEMVTTD